MTDKKPEADLYVNLKRPLELRRNILECSKDVLYTLQKVEKIKLLRKQKNDLVQQLKVQIGEINLLTAKLSDHLPEYTFNPKAGEELLASHIKEMKHDGKYVKKKEEKTKEVKQPAGKKGKNDKKGKKSKQSQQEDEEMAQSRALEMQLSKVQGKLKKLRN